MKDKIIKIIKFGKLNTQTVGENLFGEKYTHISRTPAKYEYLLQLASDSEISKTELHSLILEHGKADLLLDALICTQDFETFADAWLKKAHGNTFENIELLKNLGMPESVEQTLSFVSPKQQSFDEYENLFTNREKYEQNKENNLIKNLISLSLDEMKKIVLAETLDERKKIVLTETPQDKISWAYELFKMKGFDLCMHADMYEHITDPKVIEEIFHINHNSPDEQAHLLNIYAKNFKLDSLFEDLLHLHIQTLIKTYSNTKELKKTKKYTISESYAGGHLKFVQNLMSQNLSPYEKFKLASIACLFSNKEFKEYYQTLASEISYEYLCSLRNANLNSYNKGKYMLITSRHYDHHDYEKFVKLVDKAHPEHCKKRGMVQEWIKFMFAGGTQRDEQYFYWANNRQGINWNAYYNGEAYKNFPISQRAVFGQLDEEGNQDINGGKYPFFIIARQAQKSLKFKPELLYSDELYLQGFNHDIFKNPHPVAEKVLSEMQNNPYAFIKRENNFKVETIYFVPQENYPGEKNGVFVIAKNTRNYGEVNLYFVASLKDSVLKLYNQGTPVTSPLKEEFLFNNDYSQNCIPKNMMWWYDMPKEDCDVRNSGQIFRTMMDMPKPYQTKKMFDFLKELDPKMLHTNNRELFLQVYDEEIDPSQSFFDSIEETISFEELCNNQNAFDLLTEEELNQILDNQTINEFENFPLPEFFEDQEFNPFAISEKELEVAIKKQPLPEIEPIK